jgi:hypothetical protein
MGVTTITPTLITQGMVQLTSMSACTACGDRFKPGSHKFWIRFTKSDGGAVTAAIQNIVTPGSPWEIAVAGSGSDGSYTFYHATLPKTMTDYIDEDGYININYTTGTVTANMKIGIFRIP